MYAGKLRTGLATDEGACVQSFEVGSDWCGIATTFQQGNERWLCDYDSALAGGSREPAPQRTAPARCFAQVRAH